MLLAIGIEVGVAAGGLFILLFGALSLGLLVLTVFMLVDAAKKEEWVWFVLMLLFGPLLSFVYWLAAYKSDSGASNRRKTYARRQRKATTDQAREIQDLRDEIEQLKADRPQG